jgi:hypothetical protein
MNDRIQLIQKLPLWKSTLEEMRAKGYSYESQWPTTFFEERLHQRRDTASFAFEMLALRHAIEEEDNYYLQECESGAFFRIPSASEHGDIARSFDASMRRFAVRSISLRAGTLSNPVAVLTDSERRRMEKELERAAVRLVLISRARGFEHLAQKHSPKLLKKHQGT